MLYTVELDTAPGLVDVGAFDVADFAESLEKYGALDAAVSMGDDGSLGFTAQFEDFDVLSATKFAIAVGGEAFGNYFPIESIRVYLTPALEEVEAA